MVLSVGFAIATLGLFVPVFYVSSYAIDHGVSPQMPFYLLAALNGASLFGRVIPSYLADRYGHYNVAIIATLASAVAGFCWAATSLGGLVVLSLLYGFASGVCSCCCFLSPPEVC